MRTHTAAAVLAALFVLACEAVPPTAPGPDAPSFGKASAGSGGALVADVTGDVAFAPSSSLLASTCPAEVGDKNPAVLFRHSGCLIVTTTPAADGTSATLTDDVTIEVKSRKGSILELRLTGQDAIGPDGIMHESDWVVLPAPVYIERAGTTVVHVHADALEVWRLSGHLRGGRVALVGTVAIGDIIYRPAP